MPKKGVKTKSASHIKNVQLAWIVITAIILLIILSFYYQPPGTSGKAATQAASTISRNLPSSVEASQLFNVSLYYVKTDVEDWLLVDEEYPVGFIVTNTGGGSQATPGHLKWSVSANPTTTTYTYTLRAPSAPNTYTFTGGIFLTEGMQAEAAIVGDTSIIVTSCDECQGDTCASSTQISDCTPDAQGCNRISIVDCSATTPYCSGGVCRICTQDSHCDDGSACTVDVCSGFTCDFTQSACIAGQYCDTVQDLCVPCLASDADCNGQMCDAEMVAALRSWENGTLSIIDTGKALDLWKISPPC